MLKKAKCNTGGEAIEGIDVWVHYLIDEAARRAKANGRKTVRCHDFSAMG